MAGNGEDVQILKRRRYEAVMRAGEGVPNGGFAFPAGLLKFAGQDLLLTNAMVWPCRI